jgi:methylmalonyl-CoA mutase cobalamin-binding subunit
MLNWVLEYLTKARRKFGASNIGFDGHQRGKKVTKKRK